MRIAIEATCLTDRQPTGVARYAEGLLAGLCDLDRSGDGLSVTALYRISRWRRRGQILKAPGLKRQAWRGAGWPLRKPWSIVHASADRIPPWVSGLRTATIHDVYAALGINFDDPRSRERQMAFYRRISQEMDYVVFVSERSRQDFLEHIGYDKARTSVTPLGVSARFSPQPRASIDRVTNHYSLIRPYLLFVGLTNPNKNLLRLVEAYALSKASSDFDLVIVGEASQAVRLEVMKPLVARGLDRNLRFTGYVPDRDVVPLYAGASAFLFPSLYEGFGLPILEAMACGVPVLTSVTGACPATAGGYARLVDPHSPESIASGIDNVVNMPISTRAAATEYAKTHTWRRTAELTLSAWCSALEIGRR